MTSDTEGTVTFPVQEVVQPIGTFYVGVINAVDLFYTAFSDVRNLENRDLDLYIGIQRPLSAARIQELKNYVTNVDATFPTGIILSAGGKDILFDRSSMTMTVERRGNIFRILDGQHRLMAFESYAIAQTPIAFDIPIMIFIDMDVEDQAQVFATINLAQTKVNKSLAYDLFAFARDPSPQKTAHQVARLLNKHEKSPYRNRVKILGRADLGGELLTQAAIVDKVLPMITADKRQDRDAVKRGGWPSQTGPGSSDRTVFRAMWCSKKDEQIGLTILRYFASIAERWPQAWDSEVPGIMLSRTNGFNAFMNLLREFLKRMPNRQSAPEKTEFEQLMSRIPFEDDSFNTDDYQPGTSGESALTRDLREAVGL